MNNDSNGSTQNPSTTIPIPSRHPSQPDKAEISIDSGEDFYREIRIDNVLKDEDGEDVELKEGADVDVTIEAELKDTTNKRG